MKSNFLLIIITMLITASSCKSKEQKDAENYMKKIEEKMKENPVKTGEQQKANEGSLTIPAGLENIVGDWEMVSSIVDTNDNLQIDEEERPNLKPVNFKDIMKLNRDGSGFFTVAQMEGRYEIKENEDNGRNMMTWFDKTGSPHRVGSIMKVTKDELTIKEPGGNGLFLWKRL